MADDVWAWCEKSSSLGRTVTVKVKWANFQISTRSRSLERAIQTRDRLHGVALGLIRSVFPPQRGVRLVGVTLSNFRRLAPAKGMSCHWVKRKVAPFPGTPTAYEKLNEPLNQLKAGRCPSLRLTR
jgi:hypothetical protein